MCLINETGLSKMSPRTGEIKGNFPENTHFLSETSLSETPPYNDK